MRFIITIIIDEKEVDIDVPSDVYYENEVGGMLQVGYYKGALGFAFYEYIEQLVQRKQNSQGINIMLYVEIQHFLLREGYEFYFISVF